LQDREKDEEFLYSAFSRRDILGVSMKMRYGTGIYR